MDRRISLERALVRARQRRSAGVGSEELRGATPDRIDRALTELTARRPLRGVLAELRLFGAHSSRDLARWTGLPRELVRRELRAAVRDLRALLARRHSR